MFKKIVSAVVMAAVVVGMTGCSDGKPTPVKELSTYQYGLTQTEKSTLEVFSNVHESSLEYFRPLMDKVYADRHVYKGRTYEWEIPKQDDFFCDYPVLVNSALYMYKQEYPAWDKTIPEIYQQLTDKGFNNRCGYVAPKVEKPVYADVIATNLADKGDELMSVNDMETIKAQIPNCEPARQHVMNIMLEKGKIESQDWNDLKEKINYCQQVDLMSATKSK